jgi:peptidyl-prolyl cis-trans isomerase B (cyclophilin B)
MMLNNNMAILMLITCGLLMMACFFNGQSQAAPPPEPPLKITAQAAQAEVVIGEWIEITLTMANTTANPMDIIKPILDIDAVSFQIKTTPLSGTGKSFVYSVITPSVYEHNRAQMARMTLAPNGQAQETFKLPAAVLGLWEITTHYQGGPGPLSAEPLKIQVIAKSDKQADKDNKPKEGELIAKIETSKGTMKCRFFFNDAPNTVMNFLRLAKGDFYDKLKFHRIMKGFMIQGGCPQGTGTGNPGYSIKAEFNKNKHLKGTLSMARSTHNDSAGSQFFICLNAQSNLDNKYTTFGELISGHEALDSIGNTRTVASPSGEVSQPTENVTIRDISFEFKEAPKAK